MEPAFFLSQVLEAMIVLPSWSLAFNLFIITNFLFYYILFLNLLLVYFEFLEDFSQG